MSGLSANKKILLSLLVFILITAAVVGVLLIVGGGNKKTPTAEESGLIYSSGASERFTDNTTAASETESSTRPTTSPAMNGGSSYEQSKIIEAYISGSYYISAIMYSDSDEPTEIDMALRGSDFQTTVNVEGMRLTCMYTGGKIYFLDENKKKYIEFSPSLLGISGVDLSEMEELTESLSLASYNFKGVEVKEAELNGNHADCYRYYTDDMSVYFYFIGNELKQIEYADADGNVGIRIEVKQFYPELPANVFNLSGFTKSTIFDFFGESFGQ